MDNIKSQDSCSNNDIDRRREELVKFATNCLDAARPCIPELEALLDAFTGAQVTYIRETGLITWLRDLRHNVQAVEATIQKLKQPPQHRLHNEPGGNGRSEKVASNNSADTDGGEVVTKADLDAIWKRLEPRTTDLSHTTSRWQVLRRCASLVTVKRTFQGVPREVRRAAVLKRGPQTGHEKMMLDRLIKEQAKAEVTIVDRGACWIDVRWISTNRLARQMTDSGWSWGEYQSGDIVDRDEWEDAPFVKQVRRVVAAARCNRHEYRFPTIRLVLPNLTRGKNADIDVLLEQLPRIDPSVNLVVEDAASNFLSQPAPPLADTIRALVGSGSLQVPLTDTINLEHTVLVDLISDLTHLRLEPQPWQSRSTRAQIEEENAHADGVMAPVLYPLLQGRRLVCTHEAANHFHAMLTTVGTATERERGRLLVPDYGDGAAGSSSSPATAVLRARFDALSVRPLPADIQFPVEVLAADEPWNEDQVRRLVEQDGVLPPVALEITRCGVLRSSRFSTYMHGWRADIVTVTSNKEIRPHMRSWVEAARTHDDERGPQLYCVDVTRNLLAKGAQPPPGWNEKVSNKEGGEEACANLLSCEVGVSSNCSRNMPSYIET
ncbi:hypothetical protein ISF_02364 [Cordyceps fumosorosea ARSEF 2679]|uniref:DUF1308 domain-containing protein n=1 Tax=Cordyceps fumosorosea (strain ARSEF 2679) TaxID=1081104 RepID=A0A168BPP8_CORFA|nr:hypothetical protein ISF_02364 [Cordyceps fumosorosea ARSEF 2679]OAA70390.1 hypothetical protein ISF_02364 [Cordyceps fumosorosea ARSEF 2679]